MNCVVDKKKYREKNNFKGTHKNKLSINFYLQEPLQKENFFEFKQNNKQYSQPKMQQNWCYNNHERLWQSNNQLESYSEMLICTWYKKTPF